MNVWSLLMPAITLVFALFTVVFARQLRSKLRTVRSGTATQGRCVRAYYTQAGTGTDRGPDRIRNHVFGFTTASGQWVEFEESVSHKEQGEPVTVHYDPGNPRRTATTAGGEGSPVVFDVLAVVALGFFTVLLGAGLLLSHL